MNNLKHYLAIFCALLFCIGLDRAHAGTIHTSALAGQVPQAKPSDSVIAPRGDATLMTRDRLTDDWFGLRTSLEDHGLKIDLSFTEYYAGLFQGGIADKSFEFGGRADAFVQFDTEKMGLWSGGSMQMHLESRFGDSAARTSPRSGGLWPPNSGVALPLGEPGRLVASSLYLRQKLSDSATLMIGKINAVDLLAGDPFFGGWARDRFSNIAFVAPPSGVVPPTIIGSILSYQMKPVTFTLMAFDPDDRTNDYWPDDLFDNGVNLSLGATWSGAIAGRSSSVNVTGTYSTKDGANLSEFLLPADLKTGVKDGSYNVSMSISHLLYELRDKPGKGFGVYAKAAIADGNPNPIQSSFVGGFAGHGVIPGRPRDVFGVGYYSYNFSDDLQTAAGSVVPFDDEKGLEFFYNLALTPWLRITADLQWIDPANPDVSQAWIGGLRANITF